MKKIFKYLFVFLFAIFLTGCVDKKLVIVDKTKFNNVNDIRENTSVLNMSVFSQNMNGIDPFCDTLDCYIENFKNCKNSQINLIIDNNQYSSYVNNQEDDVCNFFIINMTDQKKSLKCDFYREELNDDLFYYLVYGYKPKNNKTANNIIEIVKIACKENDTIKVKL